MIINTNVSALNALSNLNKVQNAVSSSMEKLSSGFRINKAGDDAAGLGIANQMDSDVMAMQQTSRNAEQAGSVLQIMDGATQNLQSILERMKELAAESGSDTVDDNARTKIDNEFGSLTSELDRIVDTTKFQGANLLDGSFGSKISNLGTVNTAATGSLTGAAHIASAAVTSADTFAGISSDVTASVINDGVSLGSTTGTGVTAAVNSPATAFNALTAGTMTISSTFHQTDVASTAFGSGATITGTSITSGTNTTTASGLAAGTYTIVATANSGDATQTDYQLQLNGSNVGTAVTGVAAGAGSVTLGGITLALKTNNTDTEQQALNGTTFTVAQEYNVNASGVTPSTTQANVLVTDDGSAKSINLSSFGVTLGVAAGDMSTLNGATVAVNQVKAIQLSGTDATGTTVTQKQDLNSNPAGQALTFSTFGVSLTLAAGATAANLGTELGNTATQKLVHNTGHAAQFLVSASQSYTGNDLITLQGIDLSATTLGVNRSAVDLTTAAGAQAALTTIDSAISKVGAAIGDIGADENRIQYADTNVKTAIQNFTAAESTIKDVDMASEMTNFSKNQILAQAGTAMLAQANQLGSSVLKLLQ